MCQIACSDIKMGCDSKGHHSEFRHDLAFDILLSVWSSRYFYLSSDVDLLVTASYNWNLITLAFYHAQKPQGVPLRCVELTLSLHTSPNNSLCWTATDAISVRETLISTSAEKRCCLSKTPRTKKEVSYTAVYVQFVQRSDKG